MDKVRILLELVPKDDSPETVSDMQEMMDLIQEAVYQNFDMHGNVRVEMKSVEE